MTKGAIDVIVRAIEEEKDVKFNENLVTEIPSHGFTNGYAEFDTGSFDENSPKEISRILNDSPHLLYGVPHIILFKKVHQWPCMNESNEEVVNAVLERDGKNIRDMTDD